MREKKKEKKNGIRMGPTGFPGQNFRFQKLFSDEGKKPEIEGFVAYMNVCMGRDVNVGAEKGRRRAGG